MRPSSAKAKGRRLQNAIAAAIRQAFRLHSDDVRPAVMGESGEDIKLSPVARACFPYAVEAKNTERLNVWAALAQAEANAACSTEDAPRTPMVVFTRNRSKTYAIVEFDHLLEVLCREKE